MVSETYTWLMRTNLGLSIALSAVPVSNATCCSSANLPIGVNRRTFVQKVIGGLYRVEYDERRSSSTQMNDIRVWQLFNISGYFVCEKST